MGKKFVTRKIAQKLALLGFDELCLTCYIPEQEEILDVFDNEDIGYFKNSTLRKNVIAAPLWQEAMEWIEKNKIYFDRYVDFKYGHCTYNLKWHNGRAFVEQPCKGGEPLEALQTAIELALNILETITNLTATNKTL